MNQKCRAADWWRSCDSHFNFEACDTRQLIPLLGCCLQPCRVTGQSAGRWAPSCLCTRAASTWSRSCRGSPATRTRGGRGGSSDRTAALPAACSTSASGCSCELGGGSLGGLEVKQFRHCSQAVVVAVLNSMSMWLCLGAPNACSR